MASFKLCYYGNGHDAKQSHCLDVLRGKGGWAPLLSLAGGGTYGEHWDCLQVFHFLNQIIVEGLELAETHEVRRGMEQRQPLGVILET